MEKKNRNLIRMLLFVLFFCANMHLCYVYAGSTEYVTMREGETKTLFLNVSKPGAKGAWTSTDQSTVVIQSQNYVSCTVKAVKETSNLPVVVHCKYTYMQDVGKYTYIRNDYKDFYVTVLSSGSSGGGSNSLSASSGTMYLDLSGGSKELTLTAGRMLSPTLFIQADAAGSKGCVSVGKLDETKGRQQTFVVFPESVGRQSVCFELLEQVQPGYVYILKKLYVNFVVTCSHTYDQGRVTKEPTAAQPGVKTYTCKNCKAIRTEQLEWKGQDVADCEITISNDSLIYDGSEKKPSVLVEYKGTKLAQNTDYLLSYSNNTNAGTGLIKITGTGSYTGQVEKTFTIGRAKQELVGTITEDHIAVGQTAKITAAAAGRISYRSSNDQTASVDSDGVVTGKKAGTAVITVMAQEADNYEPASLTFTMTVSEPQSSAGDTGTGASLHTSVSSVSLQRGQKQEIVVSIPSGYRSGLSMTVIPSASNVYAQWVTGQAGSRHSLMIWGFEEGNARLEIQLTEESSQTILDTAFVDVTVTGKANTAGTIDISKCSLNFRTVNYVYNGTARNPYIMLSYGHQILKKDKDYTVEYINNVNAGTAEARICGKGSYTGSITRTFTIDKARQRFQCLPYRRYYTKRRLAGTEIFTITVKNAKGTVSYKSSNSRYITVSNGTAYISQDTPAGTYTITVTASGDENYKPAVETITIRVR